MIAIRFALAISTLLLGAMPAAAQSPSWSPPAESARCPSKWGAGDERGAANHMKPQTVLNAIKLIKTGEVIELAQTLNGTMPMFGTRRFDMHVKRTFMNMAPNERGSNEELVITEIGQVGTQLDGFAHQTHGNSLYNCFKVDQIATRTGFDKLGIDKVGTIMTRGVLIDVAGSKGVEMLDDTYEITVEDLEAALRKQKPDPAAGGRNHYPHRPRQAVGQGQRALQQIGSGHRRQSRRVADRQGPDPARIGHLPG